MTRPICKEGFLEEVAFKLTPAGLRTQDGGPWGGKKGGIPG